MREGAAAHPTNATRRNRFSTFSKQFHKKHKESLKKHLVLYLFHPGRELLLTSGMGMGIGGTINRKDQNKIQQNVNERQRDPN